MIYSISKIDCEIDELPAPLRHHLWKAWLSCLNSHMCFRGGRISNVLIFPGKKYTHIHTWAHIQELMMMHLFIVSCLLHMHVCMHAFIHTSFIYMYIYANLVWRRMHAVRNTLCSIQTSPTLGSHINTYITNFREGLIHAVGQHDSVRAHMM